MLKKLAALAAVAASAAAIAVLPSSAAATGTWDCYGPWHSWGQCTNQTYTSGPINWQAFSSAGTPYYVYITVKEISTTWSKEYGPMSGVTRYYVTVPTGYASVYFNNYHSTNNGSQLYNLNVK